MNKVYVLSYISKKSFVDHAAGRSFSVPISGFYRGHKVAECVICEVCKNVEITDLNYDKIAIMKITLLSIEKNKILGRLSELNFF